jgi:hypothetical protein
MLVWNLHRRYGPLRLPRLLAGWEESGRFGWESSRLDATTDHRRRFEPLFVLRRNGSADLPVVSSREEWPWDAQPSQQPSSQQPSSQQPSSQEPSSQQPSCEEEAAVGAPPREVE